MPKKTKREKIIAEYRRRLKILKTIKEEVPFDEKIEKEGRKTQNKQSQQNQPVYKFDTKIKTTQNQQVAAKTTFSQDYSYVAKGLFKTLTLAFLIILLELALFWYFEKGGQNILSPLITSFVKILPS